MKMSMLTVALLLAVVLSRPGLADTTHRTVEMTYSRTGFVVLAIEVAALWCGF